MKGGPRYKPTSLQVMAKGIGQGLWPTPTAGDSKTACNATATRKPESKHHQGTTLTDAVRSMPTNSPTGPEATSSNPTPSLWPTPTSAMAERGATNAERAREPGQTDQAKTPSMWPTPTATDHKGPETRTPGKERQAMDDRLSTRALRTANGRLSCALVTYLMGFPMNWFDPSPATVPKSSKPWATPSSPKSPPSS